MASELVPILVPLIFFGSITAWVIGPKYLRSKHELRLRELEIERERGRLAPADPPERKRLEERVVALESIVCSVDYELNAKLNRLASRELRLPSPPPTPKGVDASPLAVAPTVSAHPPAISALGQGSRLAGRFVIERRLGGGGMGTVYLARDETLGEPVAVKVLREGFASDANVAERFRREVSVARRIVHPNVVRLYDVGDEAGTLFLSMEYVDGESLAERIRRRGPLPLPDVAQLAAQLCDGLIAAHAAGVVHRDLKPANILVRPDGHAKIIDFGVAKLAELEGMTATNLILGTPEYMAPEQVRGRAVEPRTDLYAVGAVLYEALAGRPPFRGDSAIAVGFAVCTSSPTALGELRHDVPEAWQAFVHKALEKEPAARFASAEAMLAAIPRR